MKIEIDKHGNIIIDGEYSLNPDSVARCYNRDCPEFGAIVLCESPDVCCDGPHAIYTLHHVEHGHEGEVLASVVKARHD